MEDAILYGRLQFAFTITFHYIFPQLTMGLSLLIVILKSISIFKNNEKYNLVPPGVAHREQLRLLLEHLFGNLTKRCVVVENVEPAAKGRTDKIVFTFLDREVAE